MIDRQDGSQRRRALRALGLAQAADGGTLDDASDREGAIAWPPPLGSAPDESVLDKLGRDPLESFGCPHCISAEVRRRGDESAKPRYRCVACGKTFKPLTGTPLVRLHHQERWAGQAQACGRYHQQARHETFILESFKGTRGKLAHPARKQGGEASKRGLSLEQIPDPSHLIAVERQSMRCCRIWNIASMTAVQGQMIIRGSELGCDDGKATADFPGAPQFHINNVNAYHNRLKEWMRSFHGVANDNLPSWR